MPDGLVYDAQLHVWVPAQWVIDLRQMALDIDRGCSYSEVVRMALAQVFGFAYESKYQLSTD